MRLGLEDAVASVARKIKVPADDIIAAWAPRNADYRFLAVGVGEFVRKFAGVVWFKSPYSH